MNEAATTASPRLAEAWKRFHAAQEDGRRLMEATPRFRDFPQHRAKAYHTLLEAAAMAYNFAVAPRMEHPRINRNTSWQTDVYTLGQNGPDFYYAVTMLDGRQDYRLSGKLNDCTLFLVQVLNHLSGHPDSRVIGNYDLADFDIGADGRFEFILSARKHEGNWMPLDPDCRSHMVLMRRAMGDWNDVPPDTVIERISEIPPGYYDDEEFDEDAMAARIETAAAFFSYLIRDFNINLYDMYLTNGGGFNNMAFLPGVATSQVGSPSSRYAQAVFDIDEDEALILELDRRPDGAYWSYQVGDVWSRSLNFTHRQTSLSNRHAIPDGDGVLRVVLAHRDPGIANWLDTCGRRQGTVVFRNFRALTDLVPTTRKVKFADLAAALPADTARVTPAARAAALRARHAGLLKLHGE